MDKIIKQREWMKANFVESEDMKSDQELKLPQPPLQKSYDENDEIITLLKLRTCKTRIKP